MTVLIFVLGGDGVVLQPGKQEEPHPCTKAYAQEEPSIEGHCYQHEQIAPADLNHMEDRLEHMET